MGFYEQVSKVRALAFVDHRNEHFCTSTAQAKPAAAKAPPKKKKRPMMKLVITDKHGEVNTAQNQPAAG